MSYSDSGLHSLCSYSLAEKQHLIVFILTKQGPEATIYQTQGTLIITPPTRVDMIEEWFVLGVIYCV